MHPDSCSLSSSADKLVLGVTSMSMAVKTVLDTSFHGLPVESLFRLEVCEKAFPSKAWATLPAVSSADQALNWDASWT